MRKIIISPCIDDLEAQKPEFFDLESLAQVEISSENPRHPIEYALLGGCDLGWQAATTGEQMIRLIFDQPVDVKRILLVIDELVMSRTQEFALFWLRHGDRSYQEILRQQFIFSPPDTCQQVERYSVDLKRLKILKLNIVADINNRDVLATLAKFRVG